MCVCVHTYLCFVFGVYVTLERAHVRDCVYKSAEEHAEP